MWNFVAEKQLFSLFFAVSAANLQRYQKSINGVTSTSDTQSLGLKQHGNEIRCAYISLLATPIGPVVNPEMLSTVRFYV